MKPAPCVLLAALGLLTGCATRSDKDLFTEADANKDGRLTLEEVNAMGLPRLFDRFDGNRDGAVTQAEAQAVEPGFDLKLFTERDLNKDGKVSYEEYLQVARRRGGLKQHFAAVDTNRDGFIDKAEAAAHVERLEKSGAPAAQP